MTTRSLLSILNTPTDDESPVDLTQPAADLTDEVLSATERLDRQKLSALKAELKEIERLIATKPTTAALDMIGGMILAMKITVDHALDRLNSTKITALLKEEPNLAFLKLVVEHGTLDPDRLPTRIDDFIALGLLQKNDEKLTLTDAGFKAYHSHMLAQGVRMAWARHT